jgi:hypothetical protein
MSSRTQIYISSLYLIAPSHPVLKASVLELHALAGDDAAHEVIRHFFRFMGCKRISLAHEVPEDQQFLFSDVSRCHRFREECNMPYWRGILY